MAIERSLSKRELLKDLGITDRLLKYWVGWYRLPLNRRGRGSNYPPKTVETLRLIKRLSESKYFTMRFVRDLLRAADGGDKNVVESHLTVCRSVLNRQIAGARPALPAARVESKKSRETALEPELIAAPAPRGVRMGEDLL